MKHPIAFRFPIRASGRGFTLIELMVVIGIAAILITMASTSFFGAMRRESVTKSRNQLRDTLLLARQQACILGVPHVVVCWNSDAKVKVGNKEQKTKQGRFAVFQSVGTVIKEGNSLYVPFAIQQETLGTLRVNARLISLADPGANKFARITRIMNDRTELDKDRDSSSKMIAYPYMTGGRKGKENVKLTMIKFAETKGTLKALDGNRVPLAIRTTPTVSLPANYAFTKDRFYFAFSPDGGMASGSASSASAKHSVSRNAKHATFSVSVDSSGSVSVK